MKSFFFIPATKLNNIDFIKSKGDLEIIIDFEDAVLQTDRNTLLGQLASINEFEKFWYRIPVRNSFLDEIELDFLKDAIKLGLKRIIIPKLSAKRDFEVLYNNISEIGNLELILLIEHPRLLIEMEQVLQYGEWEKVIFGIGLGSHDLMTYLNAEHSKEQLYYPRMRALYLAKAYGKLAIDIASMNISNKIDFEDELSFGLENGYDAKFLVHPIQFEWINNYEGLKLKQIRWAEKVIASLPVDFIGNEVEPFILEGQIIEKPHIEKARAIIKKYLNEN